MVNIIQKDITFDFNLTLPLIGGGKALRLLSKKYDVEKIKKSWSWRKPFYLKVIVRVNIIHDVNLNLMRKKQHELMFKKTTKNSIKFKEKK